MLDFPKMSTKASGQTILLLREAELSQLQIWDCGRVD